MVALAIQTVVMVALAVVGPVAAAWAGRLLADRTVAKRARLALYLRRQGLRALDRSGESFVGSWRGRPVRLRIEHPGRVRVGSPLTLSVGTTVPTGPLKLGPVGSWFGRSCLLTGDPRFDRRFRISGDARALSIFTSEIREAVLQVACMGTPRIVDGVLWLDLRCPTDALADIPRLLDPVIELAEQFTRTTELSLVKRWVDWLTDPEPGVRRSCLELVDRHHEGAALPEFVPVLLTDNDPGVRLRAASLLGRWEIAEEVAISPSAPSEVRLEAVGLLLRRGSDSQRLRAAQALAQAGEPLSRAAVALCGAVGSGAEPLVIDWLDVERANLVRGAVRWAARYGSLAVLSRLKRIEARAARLSPLSLETREAIARVRARSAQAMGAVSLCLPLGCSEELPLSAQGGLSLADEEGGLSLSGQCASGRSLTGSCYGG